MCLHRTRDTHLLVLKRTPIHRRATSVTTGGTAYNCECETGSIRPSPFSKLLVLFDRRTQLQFAATEEGPGEPRQFPVTTDDDLFRLVRTGVFAL